MHKLAAMFAGACLSISVVPAANAASFTFQNIVNSADPTFNEALGINGSGQIAGYFGSGATGQPSKGYIVVPPYAQSNFTNQNFPGSLQTQVTGINNGGITVGFWSNTNNGVGQDNNFGFVDVAGTFTNVNNPNTSSTNRKVNQLLGVNNNNIAVGFYVDGAGAAHGYTYNIGTQSFSGNIDDPNGIGRTTAAAINNSGEIAGYYIDTMGISHGFIDQAGIFKTIDPTGSKSTMLLGLNDNGFAVGTYTDAGGVMHGLLFDLNTNAFQNIDDPFILGSTIINGINDLNQLVGFYVDATGNTIGLLANPTTVPLPAALPLFASGLGALGLLGWRRKRKVEAV